MNWYITKIVFKINQGGQESAQFDEQWRLIEAASEEDAFAKAELLGQSESELLERPDGRSIRWEFISVTDIFPFSADLDGGEVFSRIEQPDNESFYLRSVKEKAARFQVKEYNA